MPHAKLKTFVAAIGILGLFGGGCLTASGVFTQNARFTTAHVFFYSGLGLFIVAAGVATFALRRCFNARIPRAENRFSDFRVIKESEHALAFDVWYFYNGILGDEDIHIDVHLLAKDGKVVSGGGGMTGFEITIINHKALAHVNYSYQVYEPNRCTHIQVCMAHFWKGTFHCQTFPYKRVWRNKG